MAGEPEELLKQVEEAREASSAFDRRVAMSMAIVAAMLALVTMLGHRAHNETLRLQAEANHLRTQANIYHTEASDQWAYYQAKNIRGSEDQFFLALLSVVARQPGDDAARRSAALRNQWNAEMKRYQQQELPALRAKAQALDGQAREAEAAAQRAIGASYGAHNQGDRLDYAELGVELSLVLMSLAVLTKRETFWHAGIVAGVVGVAIAGWAMPLG
jgi:hypothetical protein